jgi:hypothetical protein
MVGMAFWSLGKINFTMQILPFDYFSEMVNIIYTCLKEIDPTSKFKMSS